MSVDTLSLAKELRAADFASPQAESIAAAIGRAVIETSATKADLARVEASIHSDVALVDANFRTEVAKLDIKIESSINKLLFRFIGTQLATGGIVVALIKLLPAQG